MRRVLASMTAVVAVGGAAAAVAATQSGTRDTAAKTVERVRALVLPEPRLPAAVASPCPSGRPLHERLITHRRWLTDVQVTEYYSTPERWFAGRKVRAPGLPGRHRVDWLYSARGIAMEGDGIGDDGRHYHIADTGTGAWVNKNGHKTIPGRCAARWSRGTPVWYQGGWRNAHHQPTFPLAAGGWSNGPGDRSRPYPGVTFAPGSSITLQAYRTLAVDPRLIPRGSRIYIPYYKGISGGWFVASDTGGAIIGHHVDVYRPPTATPLDGGRFLQHQRILVVPPGS